jgi:hypothetical protein
MSNLAGKIGIRFTDAARDANAAVVGACITHNTKQDMAQGTL